ncbi:MAG: ferrous iron transport protein A [Zoogloeaceae bacterium]|jgi:ferrous iron transport protein A|nr:ferrous iron transport protein A [Zoogloeaceae bacterium]
MTNLLEHMRVGRRGVVAGFAKSGGRGVDNRAYRQKLLSMGLTRGVEFQVTRQAPMGDPVEISVRGFSLSLRKDEAAALLVEWANDSTNGASS